MHSLCLYDNQMHPLISVNADVNDICGEWKESKTRLQPKTE
jgi:hypothetical protein